MFLLFTACLLLVVASWWTIAAYGLNYWLDKLFFVPYTRDFSIMSRHDISSKIDGVKSLYLRRYEIIKTPWFAVFIHKIVRSDSSRHLHDHPWRFWMFILNGWYWEETPARRTRRCAGEFLRRAATWRHRIIVPSGPVWTLFIRGRKTRDWGFWVDGIFVPEDQYKEERDES